MLHCFFLTFVFIVAIPEITGLQCKGVGGSVHTPANLIFHFSNKNGKRKYYLSLSYLHILK